MQHFDTFLHLSESLAGLANNLYSAEALKALTEEESGDVRKLFRWLNNLQGIESGMEEWLEGGTPDEQIAKIKTLHQLMSAYATGLRKSGENILGTQAVVDANDASASIALAVAEHTLDLLPEGHPGIEKLEKLIPSLPKRATLRLTQSVQRLLSLLAAGIERSSGKSREQSPVERLVEMSGRIQSTARKLRSIDTLEPPAREESIELAREILRRLKNLGFSDKPIKAMVDTGKPEDKAALAEEFAEVADSYRNLLSEAAQLNPSILQDHRIKEANDAVNVFSHAVKLMAAKEIPVSAAASQQISADITQTPDKELHDRAVDKLIKSMEGGLGKAAEEIQAQQDQQQQQEEAQEAAEAAALSHSDRSRRKKRKRRSSHSGGGGKKQQKLNREMTADDFVLKQGRFSQDQAIRAPAPIQPPMQGLSADALAAIRQLGGALLNVGNQAKDLSNSLANVSSTDKIAPDDKTVSQRIIEEQQKNPKNQGPRV